MRAFQCQLDKMKGALVIENDRVIKGTRFLKWATGKHVSQVRPWLRDKSVIVTETEIVKPSKSLGETPDKWKPVAWYRAGALVFGFQGDTVTRASDHAFIGETRASMRAFCLAEGVRAGYMGTGLREYVWQTEEGLAFGLSPRPSTVYALIPSAKPNDTAS